MKKKNEELIKFMIEYAKNHPWIASKPLAITFLKETNPETLNSLDCNKIISGLTKIMEKSDDLKAFDFRNQKSRKEYVEKRIQENDLFGEFMTFPFLNPSIALDEQFIKLWEAISTRFKILEYAKYKRSKMLRSTKDKIKKPCLIEG